MRKYFIIALVILIGLSFSDSAESSPVSNNNQSYHEFSKTYGLGYECVWESVVQVFEQNHIPIKSMDKDSGIVVSLDKSLPSKDQRHSGIFNAEDFDCGEPGRFKHFSKTTGTFTVIVKKREDLTIVQVEASGKALVGDYAGIQEQWRNCSSNGILEDKFLELQGRNIFFPEPAGMNLANQAREGEDDLEKGANKLTVNDPLEGWNRFVFKINDKIYFWALKPAAKVYAAFIPLGLRTAIDNAARNFEFPARFANCVLQKKGEMACVETERVLINSTLGLGGMFDVAQTGFGISGPHEEDFGQTLTVWGVHSGPFLMLPVLGPSDARDTFGYAVDHTAFDPLFWISYPTWVSYTVKAEKIVNKVSLMPGQYEAFKNMALDPYVSMRDAYMQRRENAIKQ
jgi:phospholipid-binding lipoprotein MlaA